MRYVTTAALLSVCLLVPSPALSFEFILDAWRLKYPASNADDIGAQGCQLCHQSENGGPPWNQYGWDIREIYLAPGANQFDLDNAFEFAEIVDHDNDPAGAESFVELINDFQPGWTAGSVNSVFMANGTEITNQPPPAVSMTTALDFPPAISDPLPDIPAGAIAVELLEIANSFNAPLKAVKAPGINGSLFVVEQTGKIFRVDLSSGSKTLFHDVSADLVSLNLMGNDERGLLGLAFHPQYASNGLFYTYQSEPRRVEQDTDVDFTTLTSSQAPNHRSMVVEYRASNPSCNSDIFKTDTLMIIDQPQANHNGGDLAFDVNGNLYIALGDGGGSNDRGRGHVLLGNARNTDNVLGSILRIDPLGNNSANTKYGIPANNAFVGISGEDEIFAYGFRNPYRFSFDADTQDFYVADVGQNQIEEVNIVVSGENYGWNWKEGSFHFYNPNGAYISDVPAPGLPAVQDPIAEYDHDDGFSVTGGYVYRGSQIPALQGSYIFADFFRRIFYLDNGGDIAEFLGPGTSEFVAGFGQDADRELYLLTRVQSQPAGSAGKLQKLVAIGSESTAPEAVDESPTCPVDDTLCLPIKASNGSVATICL